MASVTAPLLRWLLACVLAFWVGQAWASPPDHITQRGWLDDPSGQLSWPEVTQHPTASFEGTLSRGFGASITWLRLHIDPAVGSEDGDIHQRLILRFRPVYLDDIQIFDPLSPQTPSGQTGDAHNPAQMLLRSLDFVHPIPLGEHPRDIWVRLASTSTRQIHVEALAPNDWINTTTTQGVVFAAYVGLVALIAIWALLSAWSQRERVLAIYGVSQVCALIYALFALGYVQFAWPAPWPATWLNLGSTLFSILAVSSGIGFHITLLREHGMPLWAQRCMTLMEILLPIKLLMLLAGLPIMALQLNLTEVLISPMLFLIMAIAGRGWQTPTPPDLPRWSLIGFYALLFGMLAMAALPGLGLANSGELALYVVQSHGIITAFLVMGMLQYRGLKRQRRIRQTAHDLERSQIQMEQERLAKEDQRQLLAMLTHELKTPLAVMQMRLDPQAAPSVPLLNAVADMNAVIERCVQTSQMEDGRLQVLPTVLDLAATVQHTVAQAMGGQRIQIDSPPTLLARTDAGLFQIILNNLIQNALKYSPPGSPIGIRLHQPDGQSQVCLEVTNPPAHNDWPDASRLFEKYYRAPQAQRQTGTGLGLFLTRKLAVLLGGELRYTPTDDAVRFTLTLPKEPQA